MRSLFAPVDGKVVRDQGVEAGRLAELIGAAALSGTWIRAWRGALCSWISAASVHGLVPSVRRPAWVPYCKLGGRGSTRLTVFLLKRLGLALLTLVLLSLIIFFAGQVLPGNPGRAILGPFASQHAVNALNKSLGVDRPLLTQYWSWVSGFVRGNMGTSYQFQSPVRPFLFTALGHSLKLAAVAFVIVVPLGILGGVVAALHVGKGIDRIISVTGLSFSTVPEFVSGIVLIVIFAIWLKVLPVTRRLARRRHLPHPAQVPDPARHPAGARAVRLHRPHGQGGDGGGARLRLRAHGDLEGASAPGGHLPARAAQLVAADDHRHRHPDAAT